MKAHSRKRVKQERVSLADQMLGIVRKKDEDGAGNLKRTDKGDNKKKRMIQQIDAQICPDDKVEVIESDGKNTQGAVVTEPKKPAIGNSDGINGGGLTEKDVDVDRNVHNDAVDTAGNNSNDVLRNAETEKAEYERLLLETIQEVSCRKFGGSCDVWDKCYDRIKDSMPSLTFKQFTEDTRKILQAMFTLSNDPIKAVHSLTAFRDFSIKKAEFDVFKSYNLEKQLYYDGRYLYRANGVLIKLCAANGESKLVKLVDGYKGEEPLDQEWKSAFDRVYEEPGKQDYASRFSPKWKERKMLWSLSHASMTKCQAMTDDELFKECEIFIEDRDEFNQILQLVTPTLATLPELDDHYRFIMMFHTRAPMPDGFDERTAKYNIVLGADRAIESMDIIVNLTVNHASFLMVKSIIDE